MNVTLAEFSLAASLAQCMAFWASSLEWGCVKPIPSHLWSKALPEEPNILSRGNGEQYFRMFVGHVIGEEK